MPVSPDQLELALASKIAKSVQASPDDALLGFLDVDEGLQQEVLDCLRNRPGFLSIRQYLTRYPALTCYGLAVAAPIGLQDEEVGGIAFYGAWQSAFGFSPPQSERESLAHKFLVCLDGLGLPYGTIFPDLELHIRGGCYLFHGAILPHFVEPLRAALESAQKTRPLPDPDDADRAASFATYLAEKVPPAQQRLRKTLQSRVGSFLVRRLVRWLLTRDDSLFPAHIKPLLQEQKERGVFVRGPFVQFDETEGQLQLVLPAQTPSVADSNTRWVVSGRQYRASSEQPPIPLEDLCLEGTDFDVTLSHLQGGRENVVYHLQAGIPVDRGFRVFDAISGKERRLGSTISHIVELAPGQTSLVLLHESAEVKSDHAEEQAGDLRFIRVEPKAGDAPVVIEHQGSTWTLKSKVRPGLYHSLTDAQLFRATRAIDGTDVLISYGSCHELTCAIPADCDGSAALHFSTRLDAGYDETVLCPSGSLTEGVKVASAGELLTQWIAKLPPAVHAITVCLECNGRRMTQALMHWKGLQRITIYGDFYCSNLPCNLGHINGFTIEDQALIRPRVRGGKAELTLSGLGRLEEERWEVPANRVAMTVISPDGAPSELDEGGEVEVLANDNRIIQFRTGGLLPVRLICNGKSLGEISADRPVVSRFLTTLATEHGRTGELDAQAVIDLPGDRSWKVLHWRTPQTARECRLEPGDGTQVAWLIRKVSITGVAGLRIRLVDFGAKMAGEESEAVIPLTIPVEADATSEISLGKSFACSIRRKPDDLAQVRLSFHRDEMRGSVWITELECLLSDSTVWQPVMSREAYGRLAVTRLVFIGGTPQESPSVLADLFWGRPGDPLAPNSGAWELKGQQLERWLQGVHWLLACKYPTPVWNQNRLRFRSLYERLSAVCLVQGNNEHAAWWTNAIRELDKHACEIQPVIMPCLLLSSSLKMATTPLKGCELSVCSDSGCVAKAIYEASLFENRSEAHALGYVTQAFNEQRVDREIFLHSSGWPDLMARRPVKLGGLRYKDWAKCLTEQVKGLELRDNADVFELLSATHLVSCLAKAKKRAGVLLSISERDQGHWLSGSISCLRHSRDKVLASIKGILGQRLSDAHAEALFSPLTDSDLLAEDPDPKEFLGNIMVASCLVALALRAKRAGIISFSQMDSHLHSLVTIYDDSPQTEERVNSQIALVLGTAPELFSFYFLLFTLSIAPQHDSRN